MFEILMLSNIIIILTTFVYNTSNVYVNAQANVFFCFEKAIYTAAKIQQPYSTDILFYNLEKTLV